MIAMLYRGGEFLKSCHPRNAVCIRSRLSPSFTTGKLKADDCMLLTTANLLNYVALQNLDTVDASDIPKVTEHVSKILRTPPGSKRLCQFLCFHSIKPDSRTEAAGI